MKIAIVTQSYYPIKGGVAEHVHALSGELEKLGHKVVIITANFTGLDDNYGRCVYRIGRDLTIPINGAFNNMTVGFSLKKQLEEIESKEKFDLIHIHQPIDPILPLMALKYLKAPKVGTFHTYSEGSYILETLKNQAKPFFDRLSGLIAVSSSAREYITRYLPGDYRIIPNGVDTTRFSPEVEPLEGYKNSRDFKILFVGRMDPRKGFKYLLRAFPLIYQKITNVRLIVVGNGFLRTFYHLSLPSVLRPRVDYRGFVSRADLPRYYASCDVYCSPATMGESFGIVLLEAMASGKPVIASDIRGYNSILEDGRQGYLVPKENPLALAEKIIDLACDQKKREMMGAAGRQKALTFDWGRVAKEIEGLYREVLGKKGKS
ncbi:MAG: glycosyltransferase family 4 protein [Patescibacteria group bacterium]